MLLPPLFLYRIQDDSWIIFLLIMAAIFWVYRLVKVFCNVLSYWEIRQFYIKALKIRMVSSGTWRRVRKGCCIKIVHVQLAMKVSFCSAVLAHLVILLCALSPFPRMNYATSHGRKSRTGSSACRGSSKCAYTRRN